MKIVFRTLMLFFAGSAIWISAVVGFAWYKGIETYKGLLALCKVLEIPEYWDSCHDLAVGPTSETTWTLHYLGNWGWDLAFQPVMVTGIVLIVFWIIGLAAYTYDRICKFIMRSYW